MLLLKDTIKGGREGKGVSDQAAGSTQEIPATQMCEPWGKREHDVAATM